MSTNARVVALAVVITAMWSLAQASELLTTISEDNIKEFKTSAEVTMVYAYWKREGTFKDLMLGSKFSDLLKSYGEVAAHVKSYGVRSAIVNCFSLSVADKMCELVDTEPNGHVSIFRKGAFMVNVQVDPTDHLNQPNHPKIDFHETAAHVLQVLWTDLVPIIETEEELDFLKKSAEDRPIILAFLSGLGIYEHYVVMEMAYRHQKRFQFAVTTKRTRIDLPNLEGEGPAQMWMITCGTADGCHYLKFYGIWEEKFFERFLFSGDTPAMLDSKDLTSDPTHLPELPLVLLTYDSASRERVLSLATQLSLKYRGSITVVTVDVKQNHGWYKESGLDRIKPPSVATKLKFDTAISHQALSTLPDSDSLDQHVRRLIQRRINLQNSQDTIELELAELANEVEKQDDPTALELQALGRKEPNLSHAKVLCDKSFPVDIQADLLVVLFYLPFDARSSLFLHKFANASAALHEEDIRVQAVVNCFDWTDVCDDNNVLTYPVVRAYHKGQHYATYAGVLDQKSVTSFIRILLAKSPVALADEMDVPTLEDLALHGASSVLGLLQDQSDVEFFTKLSQRFEGRIAFGYLTGTDAQTYATKLSATVPSLVVLKPRDPFHPHTLLPLATQDLDQVATSINAASLSVFPQLTIYNFGAYLAKKLPLVLLFKTPEDEGTLYEAVADVAVNAREPSAICAWLNASDPIVQSILEVYRSPETTVPALFLLNHAKLSIHEYTSPSDPSDVLPWIQDVLNDKISMSKPLDKGEWKPVHPGYNFLQMELERKRRIRTPKPGVEYDDDTMQRMKSMSKSTSEEVMAQHATLGHTEL